MNIHFKNTLKKYKTVRTKSKVLYTDHAVIPTCLQPVQVSVLAPLLPIRLCVSHLILLQRDVLKLIPSNQRPGFPHADGV